MCSMQLAVFEAKSPQCLIFGQTSYTLVQVQTPSQMHFFKKIPVSLYPCGHVKLSIWEVMMSHLNLCMPIAALCNKHAPDITTTKGE